MSNFSTRQEDQIIDAYLACAFWSGLDWSAVDRGEDNPEPLDLNYGPDDLAREAYEQLRDEVLDFLGYADADDLNLWTRELGVEQIGHDFCLTRNGHGAGFWDRFYGADDPRTEAGERLANAAASFGSSDLYVGDDGKVYVE